jgi:hypothetical protein
MMLLYATAALLSLSASVYAHPVQQRDSSLNWGECELDYSLSGVPVKVPIECATLEVPLDYTGKHSSEKLDLSLLRVKATKGPFRGSVLFNFGGPSGPGTQNLALSADASNM